MSREPWSPSGSRRRRVSVPTGVVSVCLSALLVGACGSTVHPAGGSPDALSGVVTGPGGDTAPSGTGEPAAGRPADVPGSVRPDDASPLDPQTAVSAQPGGSGGVLATRKPLRIGIEYPALSGEEAVKAIGVKGVSAGDQRGVYKVLIDSLNRSGGLGGRTIEPVWFVFDSAGDDAQVQEQSMCSTFTEDNHVDIAFLQALTTENIRRCLSARRVPSIAQGHGAQIDDNAFRQFPFYSTSGSLSLTRMAKAYVDGLAQQGFFARGSKVGLLTMQESSFVRTSAGPLRSALKAHGLTVAEEVKVPAYYTVPEFASAAPAIQSAVLRFQTAGITNVLFLAPAGGLASVFMTAAEQQHYYPRYGVTTNDNPYSLGSNAPAAQLEGTFGVGWEPMYDVPASGQPANVERKRCTEMLARKGYVAPDQTAASFYLAICDQFAVLQRAFAAAGNTAEAGSLSRAIQTLTAPIPTAAYLALQYATGRRDGIAVVNGFTHSSSCSCFRYTRVRIRT